MMIPAAMLVLAQALTPAAQAFVDDATNRLIAGEDLAPDFPVRLQALDPDERLMVIVHLRRAGFLGDIVMPVDWVLSPPARPAPSAEPRR
ncbi:hypothetical protein [Paracoccus contaminans]|uniref:Uncharacterized protein n=1 Tax=Paracoccus contaminans TaxID=1945662 RepID=A0A1W6CVQ6_9RHOB|nr:hypothetical protein [Paracoccus contaminans]ARJ68931.1 hypothetical protein B0A89_04075 [Paracoccus contaminans]